MLVEYDPKRSVIEDTSGKVVTCLIQNVLTMIVCLLMLHLMVKFDAFLLVSSLLTSAIVR